MSLHLELADFIDTSCADELDRPVERKQDGIIVHLKNGVALTVHYAAPDAYSLRWLHDGQTAGIDTAPLHRELSTFPNHLHHTDGTVSADPVTRPEADPEENVKALVEALLRSPDLGFVAGTSGSR